jgi:hypothetical protein
MARPLKDVDPTSSPAHLLGVGLRLLRAGRAVSDVAKAAYVDQYNIYSYERGDKVPSADVIKRLDDHFDAKGFLIALRYLVVSGGQMSGVSGETDSGHAEDMDSVRRQILASLATFGASTVVLPALENLRDLIDAGRDTTTRLTDWEEIVAEHASSFDIRPLPSLISELALDILDLRRTMPAQGSSVEAWHRVHAQLTLLLAHALGSAGQSRASRDWWLRARHAAEASGDPQLVSFARSKAAIQALFEGRLPPQVLLVRASEAVKAAKGQPCPGLAVALALQAQVHAMQGDRVRAREALLEQGRVFQLMPTTITTNTTSVFGWPVSRLLHTRSFASTYDGGLDDADQAQHEALDATPATSTRTRAQVRLHMALTEVRHGDVLAGLDMARGAVSGLVHHDRTTFIRFNAAAVAEAIPPQLPKEAGPLVLEYRKLLELAPSPVQEA